MLNQELKIFETMFAQQSWLVLVAAILLMTLILHTVQAFIFHHLTKRLSGRPTVWAGSLLFALSIPLGLFIWLSGLTIAGQISLNALFDSKEINTYASLFRQMSSGILLVWFLIRFIRRVEANMLKPIPGKKQPDKTLIHAVSQLLIAAVVVVAAIALLQIYGINLSAVVAFGGVGGLAVGLAARDLLSNLFGGLMVYLDRPFKVGDWVRSPDRNIEGVVEHIGWRLTRLRTFEKRPLYVPNGVFSLIAVENPSRMQHRRIFARVGIRYQDADKLADITSEINDFLHQHSGIASDQTLMVHFDEFGPSSLNILIYAFTKTTVWQEFKDIQQAIFLGIIDIILQHGAECAFPTTTLNMPDKLTVHSITS